MPDQLNMFGASAEDEDATKLKPAVVAPRVRELGARLSALRGGEIRFGTSSWGYSGWKSIVYGGEYPAIRISREGLRAYSAHPLLRTVGIDRTFYGPMRSDEFSRYASDVPDDFRFVVKAHAECTMASFGSDRRWGARAGQRNPRFLDPNYAGEFVVEPFLAGLGLKAGVLLFQFSPQALSVLGGPDGFADRLHDFFAALPRLPHRAVYAVELRNPPLLTTRYFEALADVDVEHCVNALPGMPSVDEQMRRRAPSVASSRGLRPPTLVLRWMLNPRHDYQSAKRSYEPFTRLVDKDSDTRAQLTRALKQASGLAYVLVSNKAEGSAPLSITGLAETFLS